MIVTIEEASKLANKSRSTINRDLKKGKLSRVDGGIDTSELMRVYGALTRHDTSSDTSHDASFNTHDTSCDTPKTEDDVSKAWLMRQVETLQAQLEEQRMEFNAREERLIALLTHQPTHPDPGEKTPEPSKLRRKLFGY
jgi:hypothetical protein